jgi:hypothetical protein
MTEKLKLLRNTLKGAEEGRTDLKIIRLQGVFNALLTKKYFENDEISGIEVKTLENDNPEYEKGQIIFVNLNDGGLIEIKV